jgi:hypothetical protein
MHKRLDNKGNKSTSDRRQTKYSRTVTSGGRLRDGCHSQNTTWRVAATIVCAKYWSLWLFQVSLSLCVHIETCSPTARDLGSEHAEQRIVHAVKWWILTLCQYTSGYLGLFVFVARSLLDLAGVFPLDGIWILALESDLRANNIIHSLKKNYPANSQAAGIRWNAL